MRCKNCGWENAPGSLTCEKCHAPLSASVGAAQRPVAQQPASQQPPVILKGTIPEVPPAAAFAAAAAAGAVGQVCPHCGYPLARGMQVCPNCGQAPAGQPAAGNPAAQGPAAPGPAPSDRPRPGTINPWANPDPGTFCTLKALPWQGEGVDHAPVSYSGARITLNRANTDPNNQSITSKEQAELFYEDGAWYIEDKSGQQTTYIHAGRRMRLESGDIVILGNRRFEFKG